MQLDVKARVGRSIGRYRILAPIAAGGMGTVYVAKVSGAGGFERRVALKVLHSHLAFDESFVSMFLDEARLAARIHHPNVVATIDVIEEPELAIVMELVNGAHLGALSRRAKQSGKIIPPSVVLRVIIDALAGLGAAHELTDENGQSLGLVHRDVSPQNILVGADGIARLTDFGVARAEARLTATRDGSVKGKLGYMAPEQVAGEDVDLRADLFAMGVVLWEAIAGRRLFAGESTAELVARLSVATVQPISEIVPGLEPLDAVLTRALARDRSVRFASAREMASAIEDAGVLIASSRKIAETVQSVASESLARLRVAIEAPSFGGEAQLDREATGPTKLLRNADHELDEPTRSVSRQTNAALVPAETPVAVAVSAITGPTPRRARRWPALFAVATLTAICIAMFAWSRAELETPEVAALPATAARVTPIEPPPLAGIVHVMGSDTLGGSLLPQLGASFHAAHPEAEVDIEALGSSTAFVGLFDGSAEIGASSRAIRADEVDEAARLGLELVSIPLGWDGIAVIVHPSRVLPSVDLATLGAIYAGSAPEELGTFTVITRPQESGTRAFFDERVLVGRDVASSAITIEHNDAIVTYVASDPSAIAYVAAGFVTDAVRVVPLLDEARIPRRPDHDTISEAAYPLSRPLLLYVPRVTTSVSLAFLEHVTGDAGRIAVGAHGFVAGDRDPHVLDVLRADDSAPSRVPLRLSFASGDATLDETARAALGEWLGAHSHAHTTFVIQGHTSSDEPDPGRLAVQRADAVRDVVIAHGVALDATTVVGLGATRPIGAIGSATRRRTGARVEIFARD